MKLVVFHAQARAELDQAVAYYEQQRHGLGVELLAEVQAAVSRIRQHPQIGSPHKATDYRKCLVKRFPYAIYYRNLQDRIWIAAVAHAKRRPGYWSRRKP